MKITAGKASIGFWPQELNGWNHSTPIRPPSDAFRISPGGWFYLFADYLDTDWQTDAIGQSTIGVSLDSRFADFEICYGNPDGASIAIEFVLNGQLLSRTYTLSPAVTEGDPVLPPTVSGGSRWFASRTRSYEFWTTNKIWTWDETGEEWYEVRVVQIGESGERVAISDTVRLPVTPQTNQTFCGLSCNVALKRISDDQWAVNILAAHVGGDFTYPAEIVHLLAESSQSISNTARFFFRVRTPANGSPTLVSYLGTQYALTRAGLGSAIFVNSSGSASAVVGSGYVVTATDGTKRILPVNSGGMVYSGWPMDRVDLVPSSSGVIAGGRISTSTNGPGFLDGPFSCAFGTTSTVDAPGRSRSFLCQYTSQHETVDRWTANVVAYPLPRPAAMPPDNINTSPGSSDNRGQTRFLSAVGGTPLGITLSDAPAVVYQMRIDATRRAAPPESSWFHPVGEIEYALLGNTVPGDVERWPTRGILGPYGDGQFWLELGRGAVPVAAYAGFSHVMAKNYEHCPALIINDVSQKTPSIKWSDSNEGAEDIQLETTRNGYRLPMNWYCATNGAFVWYFNFFPTVETDARTVAINGRSVAQRDYYIPDENAEIDITNSNYSINVRKGISPFSLALNTVSAVTIAQTETITAGSSTFTLGYS
jgi:hypothetical protein